MHCSHGLNQDEKEFTDNEHTTTRYEKCNLLQALWIMTARQQQQLSKHTRRRRRRNSFGKVGWRKVCAAARWCTSTGGGLGRLTDCGDIQLEAAAAVPPSSLVLPYRVSIFIPREDGIDGCRQECDKLRGAICRMSLMPLASFALFYWAQHPFVNNKDCIKIITPWNCLWRRVHVMPCPWMQ